ncbi:hypothetical protein MBLNU13_g06203t1 [Cladosporium sp. NU13]
MPGIPIYPYPTYPSDAAEINSAMDNFFDFGPTGLITHEELDQRDVDSYVGFRYTPGWFNEDAEVVVANTQWWVQHWASERQIQRLQQQVQHHAQLQAAHDQLQAQYVQGRMDMDYQSQLQNSVRANVPAHTAAPGERWHVPQLFNAPTAPVHNHPNQNRPNHPNQNPPNVPQIAAAPTAPHYNPPNVPQVLAALPSAPAQPVQLPAAPPAASRPTLPPNLPLPLAQRPPPPAGFTDQPPARMRPASYLKPIKGRPRRNVQWPENIEISLVEIATFCPNWFQTPEVVGRAIRNGWSREDIAKAQLLAEDPTSRHKLARRSGRVQKQASHAHRLLTGEPELLRSNANALRALYGMQNDLTANAWFFKHSYDAEFNALEHLGDVPLSALYAHVHIWPTGNDRLLMTQCLEFARQNPGRQLDTSHWNWIITSQGLAAPPPLANGAHRDVDALQRLRQLPDPQ